MNMAEINVNHINPFLMAAGTILRDACQMEMSIGKPYVKTTEFGEDSVIIMIGITGEMRGQVMIAMKTTKACEIASKMMMGMPVPELDEMAMSAISELGNMIMGNAATILSTKGIGIDITPPTLCRGAMKISQKGKSFVGECLCAHADPVDGQLSDGIAERWRDIVWVAFHGHLHVIHQGVVLLDMLEDLAQVPAMEHARCATT